MAKIIHTSESLKAMATEFENYHYQLEDGDKYQLTLDEVEWLEFIKNKYSIYDHITNNSKVEAINDSLVMIYTMDTIDLTEALANDGIPCKAVMLSDDSALQSIFFYSNHGE